MSCPKCGMQTLADQNFCRSCGNTLQIITQPLAKPATVSQPERSPATISKDETQRTNRSPLWGFIIMFIGVAIGIIGKMLMHEETVTVVGVLISLVGMFLTVYPYLLSSTRHKYDSIPSSQPEVLTQSEPSKYLPQERNIDFVPSITERTTGLLESSAATRQREKERVES